MAKNLRKDEKISFVTTRAPKEMWLQVKRLALENTMDGTVTQFCTSSLLEYMSGRCWVGQAWLRPLDLERKAGKTGFQQVNLPLSSFDNAGESILTSSYLKAAGLHDLFSSLSPLSKDDIETKNAGELIYSTADKLNVSGATFAYTFLYWLVTVKYSDRRYVKILDTKKLLAATSFVRPVLETNVFH